MTKIELDIDLSGYAIDLSDRYARWVGVDGVSTYGSSIEECHQNAVVFTSDQDGGEGPQLIIEDLPGHSFDMIEELIAERFRDAVHNQTVFALETSENRATLTATRLGDSVVEFSIDTSLARLSSVLDAVSSRISHPNDVFTLNGATVNFKSYKKGK